MPPRLSPVKDACHHIGLKTDKTWKLEVKFINAVKGKMMSYRRGARRVYHAPPPPTTKCHMTFFNLQDVLNKKLSGNSNITHSHYVFYIILYMTPECSMHFISML